MADEVHRRIGAGVNVCAAQPFDLVDRHSAEGVGYAEGRDSRRERRHTDGSEAPTALLPADGGNGAAGDGQAVSVSAMPADTSIGSVGVATSPSR